MNKMTNRIYEEIAEQGSIIPVPLIVLGVVIAFPAIVLGMVIEKAARWIMSRGEKDTWV